ncbi:MAG TPA: YCF48-related protein [Steroidobacteraceae bacterium]|nr:YCF48-related protein [Steroidobacteraceae bacterium]
MNVRLFTLLTGVAVATVAGALGVARAQDAAAAPATASALGVDPGTLAAEPARLAPQSLLLDIARAGSRLVAVGERGQVLLSDNRGQTWRQAKSVPTQELLTAVCFADERHGIAVGHDEIALATADAGETWARRHYAPNAQQPLLDVLCNGADAFAVGAYGAYFVSADYGATWTERKFEAQKPQSPQVVAKNADDEPPADYHLNRIVAASGARLYVAAEAGHLYRSDDTGATWSEMTSPYEGSFFGVLPLDDDSLLAYGLRGHLFQSDDAGKTWREVKTNTEAMLNDAVRLPGGAIVVVGLSGAVLVSHDGGASYSVEQQGNRKGLSAALPLGPTELVTVGEGGVSLLSVKAAVPQ